MTTIEHKSGTKLSVSADPAGTTYPFIIITCVYIYEYDMVYYIWMLYL